jgi:AcrR family transcriptional regulator
MIRAPISADGVELSTGGPRRRLQEGSTEVEQRIFAATERVLAQVGARDLSVAQILIEAGIARGSFYHYFGSKWEVINKLAENVMRDIEARMQPFVVPAVPVSTPDQLRQSIVAGCQVWAEHRAVVRAITEHWRDVPELRDMWQGVLERFTTEIAGTIEREREAGRAQPGPPARRLAATLLWSTGYALYVAGFGEIDDLPGEESIEGTLIAAWMGALYGTPEPAGAR